MFCAMRIPWLAQLGFDFTDANTALAAVPSSVVQLASVPADVVVPPAMVDVSSSEPREPPSRGRSATRARTAVLFSRLQDLGLRGVDALVLMRTRTVMVSLSGRTLRVHEGYADAPELVLRAVVTFAMARTKSARLAARDAILSHDVERAPMTRRMEPARPGDLAILAHLTDAHRELNIRWFDGSLATLPIRLSGRMATRLGHYDPGTRFTAAEIVLSRKHVVRHGWREALHTLLHEMVHQWQHESRQTIDHGREFRRKCRELGITAAACREVKPLETRRSKSAFG